MTSPETNGQPVQSGQPVKRIRLADVFARAHGDAAPWTVELLSGREAPGCYMDGPTYRLLVECRRTKDLVKAAEVLRRCLPDATDEERAELPAALVRAVVAQASGEADEAVAVLEGNARGVAPSPSPASATPAPPPPPPSSPTTRSRTRSRKSRTTAPTPAAGGA